MSRSSLPPPWRDIHVDLRLYEEPLEALNAWLPRWAGGQAVSASPSSLRLAPYGGDETLSRGELTDAREITSLSNVLVENPREDEDEIGEKIKLSDTKQFQNMVMGIIMANSVVIGLEAWYIQNTVLQWIFFFIELIFTVAYCLEIRQRFKDHGVFVFFFGPNPAWNWFDFIVTCFGVLSLFGNMVPGVSVVRIFRLLRLMHTIKFVEDLEYVLLLALIATAKLFGLIAVLLFLFSVMFTELLWNTHHPEVTAKFGDLSKSLWSLFHLMTLDGWVSNINPVIELYPGMISVFLLYIFLSAIALVTLVPAMFVDQSIHKVENEAADTLRHEKKEQLGHDRQLLAECFKIADKNRSGTVSAEDMRAMLNDKVQVDSLFETGIMRDRDEKDVTLGLFDLVQNHEDDHCHEAMEFTEARFIKGLFRQRNDLSSAGGWRSATSIRFQLSKFKAQLHKDMNCMDSKLEELHQVLLAAGPNQRHTSNPAGGLRPPIQSDPDLRPRPKSSSRGSPSQSPRDELPTRPLSGRQVMDAVLRPK